MFGFSITVVVLPPELSGINAEVAEWDEPRAAKPCFANVDDVAISCWTDCSGAVFGRLRPSAIRGGLVCTAWLGL